MPKVKHIALSTQDPEKTAKFYVDVFGMKQIGRVDHPAVSDAVAGVEREKGFSGIHHIGFRVDSLEEIALRLAAAGSARRDDVNDALGLGHGERRHANRDTKSRGNVEVKHSGPDGVMLDVSETGWVGSSGFRRQ
jgi:glyoxylase I family protein